jgi:hypothetical protein
LRPVSSTASERTGSGLQHARSGDCGKEAYEGSEVASHTICSFEDLMLDDGLSPSYTDTAVAFSHVVKDMRESIAIRVSRLVTEGLAHNDRVFRITSTWTWMSLVEFTHDFVAKCREVAPYAMRW